MKFASDAPFFGFVGEKILCGWGKGKLFFGPNDTVGIPFGPQIKPNDTISIHINFKKGEVVYYRNGAYVGRAVGRNGSNAGNLIYVICIIIIIIVTIIIIIIIIIKIVYETTLGNGPFQPICKLYTDSDTVDVTPNTNSEIYGINSILEKQVPFWLKPLNNFANFIQLLTEGIDILIVIIFIITVIIIGKIPLLVINKYMLPSFIDYLKVQINSDEYTDTREYTISIPGAERVNVIFDESKFHEDDTISILSDNINYFEVKGIITITIIIIIIIIIILANNIIGFNHDALSSDLEFNINNIAEFDYVRQDDDGIHEPIAVGDVVVRSKDFCYGDQDGGPGNRGVVSSIQDWKGSARNGVNVKWDGQEGVFLYRWGYRGVYDVMKLSTYDLMTVNKIYLTESNIIKVIDKDNLSIKLDISNNDFERKLRLIGIVININININNN